MVYVCGEQEHANPFPFPRVGKSGTLPMGDLIRPLALAKLGASDTRNESVGGRPPSSKWNVREEDVNPVPLLFPIERTHVIVNHTPCSIIAGRIAQCLRKESILAKFSDQEASALAETSDHVHFCIRLFRHNHHSDSIVVEIQRRSGNCISFHNTCRVILLAARGHATTKVKSLKPLLATNTAKSKPPEEMENLLENVGCLLKKDRVDARMLGIESLRRLSEKKCSGYESALRVAKNILSQEGHISETVFSLVQFRALVVDDDARLDSCFGERKHHDIMHSHALAILANSLSLVLTAGEPGREYVNQMSHDEKLLAALVGVVENTDIRSHDSYEAVRCLSILTPKSIENGVVERLRVLQEEKETKIREDCTNNVLEGICCFWPI